MGGGTSTGTGYPGVPAGLENRVLNGPIETHPEDWLRSGLQFMYESMAARVTDPVCIDHKWYDAEDESEGVAVVRRRIIMYDEPINRALMSHQGFLRKAEDISAGNVSRSSLSGLISNFQEYIAIVEQASKLMTAHDQFLFFPSNGHLFNASRDWFGGFKEAVYLRHLVDRVTGFKISFTDNDYANGTFADTSYKGRLELVNKLLSEKFDF